MPSSTHDLAIIGLGAVGGGALLAAARAGVRVIGLDRYAPPHVMGSTHGETRIVRAAIGEGALYSPFALRNFELLDQLAGETGDTLLDRCGLLVLGGTLPHATHVPAGFVQTTIDAALAFGIAHELVPADDVRRRFPAYATFEGERAYYEPGAGMAYPERVVGAQITRARALGAEVHLNTPALAIRQNGSGVEIETPAGTIFAARVILSVGAWTPNFLPVPLARRLTVTRQSLHWFAPPADKSAFLPRSMPVFIWNDLYGFPIADGPGGVKIATESLDAVVDPENVDRAVSDADIAIVSPRVRAAFPQLGSHLRGTTCLYTATPDCHFRIIDHPDIAGATVVSACSGHGFKHAAALGEAVARGALDLPAISIPDEWRTLG
jgi:sarcosine oxidase